MKYMIETSNELAAKGEGLLRIWFGTQLMVFPFNGETLKVCGYK